MSTVPAFASASEAIDMVHAGLGYLATTDATAMAAQTQARCLQMLEQATAMGTAARLHPGGIHRRPGIFGGRDRHHLQEHDRVAGADLPRPRDHQRRPVARL